MPHDVDIPESLAERVTAWAEANGVEDEGVAYARLLEAGLDALDEPGEGNSSARESDASSGLFGDGTPAPGSVAGESADEPIECPGCGRAFDSWDSLHLHQAGVDASHFEE